MEAIPGTTLEFGERIGGYLNYQYNGKHPELNDTKYMLTQETADNMLSDIHKVVCKYFPWIQDFVVFQYKDGTIRMDFDYLSMLHTDRRYSTRNLEADPAAGGAEIAPGSRPHHKERSRIMLNVTYLAVLEPGEDGSYSVFFPDLPGCFSYGKDLDEAQRNAAEAASLHVYGMECDNEEIPAPSVCLSKEDTDGNIVMSVTIHPDLFRMKKDNERIKTNITLPAWLKRLAEEQKVNYSRLLESALIDYLQIPKTNLK